MQLKNSQFFLVFLIALSIVLLYLLAPILTPFLLGTLLAYLMDPLVKKLQKHRVPHILSVILVFLFLFGIIFSLILMLIPIIQMQTTALVDVIPKMISWVNETVMPWVKEYVDTDSLKNTLSSSLSKTGWMFNTLLKSGYTLVEWIVDLALTAVVTFYLLRDWDKVLNTLKNLLPASSKPTILKFAHESNEVLSAFFRGQLLVMIALCFIYGIGLTLAGLQVGVMIGIIGGLLTVVPYLGSLFVLTFATLTALVQFGTWQPVIGVLVVFFIGQGLESYVLTPYLVGERLGLHPVAVIFAILAGGTLFGFFGVLLALPAAAVTMVFLRFVHQWYHAKSAS